MISSIINCFSVPAQKNLDTHVEYLDQQTIYFSNWKKEELSKLLFGEPKLGVLGNRLVVVSKSDIYIIALFQKIIYRMVGITTKKGSIDRVLQASKEQLPKSDNISYAVKLKFIQAKQIAYDYDAFIAFAAICTASSFVSPTRLASIVTHTCAALIVKRLHPRGVEEALGLYPYSSN